MPSTFTARVAAGSSSHCSTFEIAAGQITAAGCSLLDQRADGNRVAHVQRNQVLPALVVSGRDHRAVRRKDPREVSSHQARGPDDQERAVAHPCFSDQS